MDRLLPGGTDCERLIFRGGKVISPQTGRMKAYDIRVGPHAVRVIGCADVLALAEPPLPTARD